VVVVSHDAVLNPEITRDAGGRWLTRGDIAVSQLSFDGVQHYDVGRIDPASDYARRFPQQQAVDGTRMPRLADVFALARSAGNDAVHFNIETKISPLQPARTVSPEAFAHALLQVVHDHGVASRVIIQSFDWRTLAVVRRAASAVATSYLTAEQPFMDNILRGAGASPWTDGHHVRRYGGSVPRLVRAAADAVPSASAVLWSPCAQDVDEGAVREAQALGFAVVVWTLNTAAEMQQMMALGVDGIISDYPDILRSVAAESGYTLPTPTPAMAG
jgi:glycerophosphoryl diester phosphodiesterase